MHPSPRPGSVVTSEGLEVHRVILCHLSLSLSLSHWLKHYYYITGILLNHFFLREFNNNSFGSLLQHHFTYICKIISNRISYTIFMIQLLYLLGMEEEKGALRGAYNLCFLNQVLKPLLFKSPLLISFFYSLSLSLSLML